MKLSKRISVCDPVLSRHRRTRRVSHETQQYESHDDQRSISRSSRIFSRHIVHPEKYTGQWNRGQDTLRTCAVLRESPIAVNARNANESELVPACSLLLLLPLSSPPPLLLVSRFFATARLLSQRRSAEMTETGVLAHLNDGRGTTVATTVIHDHVDLRGATHHLICRVRSCCDA